MNKRKLVTDRRPGWQGPYGAVDMNVPEEHKIADETVDGYIEQLRKIVETSQRLEYGPGGIMEMKQTIADKEATIYALESQIGLMKNYADAIDKENERLQEYRILVHFIANDYYELSYEKAQWQRDDWKKRCMKLRNELENDDEQT